MRKVTGFYTISYDELYLVAGISGFNNQYATLTPILRGWKRFLAVELSLERARDYATDHQPFSSRFWN
jgi:hypothetical protein